MLVTTCPDCQTTFRISVGILEKAGGQVRCGRCATIFDANDRLRELDGTPLGALPRDAVAAPAPTGAFAGGDARAVGSGGELPPGDSWPSPATVLDALDESLRGGWLPFARLRDVPDRAFAIGAGLLAAVLGLQLVHHYRHSIADVPIFGAVVSGVYSAAGAPLIPAIDLDQFDLLDLTAVAGASGDDGASLIIETRVVNRGPGSQPYPHVFVRLLDRWEDTVAGRYFSVEEYAADASAEFDRMAANSTLDAQFVIVDPGPSATGFELELCARVPSGFDCESDRAD